MSDKCSYCSKSLTDKYYFSYGVPGLPRIYGCDRVICKVKRNAVRKVKKVIRPAVMRLAKWVSTLN